jgi:hypothetical protein
MTKTPTKKLPASESTKIIIDEAIAALHFLKTEAEIKDQTLKAWQSLKKLVPNENSFRRIRREFRDAINSAFPPILDMTKPQPQGYYRTSAGKRNQDRYEHLALWYATSQAKRWDVVGDVAREEYFKNLPSLPAQESVEQTSQPQEQPVKEIPVEPPQPTFTLSDMTLEQLGLDTETEKMVSDTLAHSGMALSDFLRQACKVYAKTVMGRVGQVNDDLSSVPTTALKEEPKYKTHPGRPAELVKRAIKAIKLHNANLTELVYKWGITQTLLQELTGSRPAMVKELMQQFKGDVDDYNARLMAEYGLDETKFRYLNRKDKSVQKPDLAALVPNGLDV